MTPHQALLKYFGYEDFREGQLEIVQSVLNGKDVLALLPTGGGKSLCFQIPALILPGVTVVVSPLISLMKDQVDRLLSLNIPAAYINSSLTKQESDEKIKQLKKGQIKLLYLSPEKLVTEKFSKILKTLLVELLVIDEAHCISQWGYDFRPHYRKIADCYKLFKKKPKIIALTATANKTVQTDIIKSLELDNPFCFYKTFSRNNLFLQFINCQSSDLKNLYLLRLIKKHKQESGIIYCSTRKSVKEVSEFLNNFNVPNQPYHSKIKSEVKKKTQVDFVNGNIDLIVSTNAFGMGVDKSNIRFVVHYQIPGNIENYYQEAGRAGRDGKPSKCYLLFNKKDIKIQAGFIQGNKDRVTVNTQKLNSIIQLASTNKCKTNSILSYFGETQKNNCNYCSSCKKNTKLKKWQKHSLLLQSSKVERQLIKTLTVFKHNKSHLKNKPTQFMTDKEICYFCLLKPKTIKVCLAIPGLGNGWIATWWETIYQMSKEW